MLIEGRGALFGVLERRVRSNGEDKVEEDGDEGDGLLSLRRLALVLTSFADRPRWPNAICSMILNFRCATRHSAMLFVS